MLYWERGKVIYFEHSLLLATESVTRTSRVCLHERCMEVQALSRRQQQWVNKSARLNKMAHQEVVAMIVNPPTS